jgi:hypothetical protein
LRGNKRGRKKIISFFKPIPLLSRMERRQGGEDSKQASEDSNLLVLAQNYLENTKINRNRNLN